MISVAAIRMQQFGVQFYQASLTANDIDKLVRFEVLSYGEQAQPVRGGRKKNVAPRRPRSTGISSSAESRRARRRISARSSAARSTSWSSTTSSAGRPAICRRSPAR